VKGLALARQQLWDAALAEFLRSRELYPTRAATRNAAIAQQRLGRYAESYHLYLALLREFDASLSPSERDTVERELTEVTAQTGEVGFSATESGVSIVLNSRLLGVTPLADFVRVNAGTHVARFSKGGFQSEEQVFTLAAGNRRLLTPQLRPLTSVGRVLVREATGRELGLLIDGALVGKTPWSGELSSGQYTIQLLGEDGHGTAPGHATVRGGAAMTLVLRAQRLDASLRIEPTPPTAAIHVDGVEVGAGIWQGRLPSGSHLVEAISPGHWVYRRRVQLSAGEQAVLRAQLERDASSPLSRDADPRKLYLEVGAGALLSRSLGAAAECRCPERTVAVGAIGAVRLGYAVWNGLGLELGGGALSLWERYTRDLSVPSEDESFVWRATDYQDSKRLAGPWLTAGAAWRHGTRWPVTTRLGAGLAVLRSKTGNSGTFGAIVSGQDEPLVRQVSIPELGAWLLTPLLSSEVRTGYRLTEDLSVDLGLALLILVPRSRERQGEDDRFGRGRTQGLFDDPAGDPVKPGVLTLPEEQTARAFLALAPTVGFKYTF
jgi:hypothetical protein